MNATQTLELILDAQSAVDDAARTVIANERLLGRGLITWSEVVRGLGAKAEALRHRDAVVEGALAHRNEWCHDGSACPICTRDREEIVRVHHHV